jgi:hypothetical protein
LFTDDVSCETLAQPEHCETNEAYAYTFTPAKLTRTPRKQENCVAYKEFDEFGADWANEVDANIERMRDEVRAALTEPCIQEAVRQGHSVSVTYIGTTDDRTINYNCQYTGKAYAELKAIAPDIEVDTVIQSFIATGQKFNAGGYGGRAGGNQLLSDLRSLYFAMLFDNLCNETIPEYREMRKSGKLKVHSRGQAIDTRDLPFAFKRAAGVEVRVPQFELISSGTTTSPQRTVMLCPLPGNCR